VDALSLGERQREREREREREKKRETEREKAKGKRGLAEKLNNLHVNQHWILGGTAQISAGRYQEPHLGVEAAGDRDLVSLDDRLRLLGDHLGHRAVVLPHEEQRGILKA